MTVYVGLVTYNSMADLPSCVAGLRAQTFPNLQLMAVDNASSDSCASWLRSNAPEIHLIANVENVGYGRAHNRLIHTAGLKAGDYYMALNPDVEVAPDYVRALVETLQGQAGIGWATGKLLMKDAASGIIYSVGHGLLRSGFAFNIGYGLLDQSEFADSREVFGAPGAAVLYKAELVNNLSQDGPFFDPGMFMYAEDTDVDWRAQWQGWRCWYVAHALAYHRKSHLSQQLQMIAIGNRYLSVLKNAEVYDLISFNLPYIVAHCLARSVVTPRFGFQLAAYILRNAPAALRRRRPTAVNRRALVRWYRWSSKQPTRQQPRLSALRHRYTCAGGIFSLLRRAYGLITSGSHENNERM